MTTLFVPPKAFYIQSSNTLLGQAKLYFFQATTLIDQPVYTTSALNVPHPQPVQADTAGIFPAIYLDPNAVADYRLQLKTSGDVLIYDEDNYPRSGGDQDPTLRADLANGTTAGKGNELVSIRRSDVEIAVSAFPINRFYLPGDIRRYGADPLGLSDSSTALSTASAVSAAGGGNIIVTGGIYKISNNVTISTSASIEFAQGGKLSVDSGKTVTLPKNIVAPITQLFTGSGTVTVVASGTTIYPQWWGVIGDGTTDEVTAWNKCQTAATNNVIKLVNGTYRFASKPNDITVAMTIEGVQADTCIFLADYTEASSTTGFLHTTVGATIFRHLRIHKAAGKTGGCGIAIKSTSGVANSFCIVEDVVITGLGGTGTWSFAFYADGTLKTSAPIGVRDLTITGCSFFASTVDIAAFYGVENARVDAGFFPAGGSSVNVRVSGTSGVPSNYVNITGRFIDTLVLDFCNDVTCIADTDININDTSNASNVVIVAPAITSDTLNRSPQRTIASGKTDKISGIILLANPSGTIAAGQIGLGITTGTTVGAAGGATALPATPVGYWSINVAGTTYKIPYYNS